MNIAISAKSRALQEYPSGPRFPPNFPASSFINGAASGSRNENILKSRCSGVNSRIRSKDIRGVFSAYGKGIHVPFCFDMMFMFHVFETKGAFYAKIWDENRKIFARSAEESFFVIWDWGEALNKASTVLIIASIKDV